MGVHGYKGLVPRIVPIVGERGPRVIVSVQPAVGAGRRLARKHNTRPYQQPTSYLPSSSSRGLQPSLPTIGLIRPLRQEG